MATELTARRRAALMAYCRLDELTEEEDALLAAMYRSAVGYMAQAGVQKPKAGTDRLAQYELCVNALVLDDWDRRGIAEEARGSYTVTENRSFRQRLNQLKLTEPVSKLDT